jgi:hypothetical protein
MSETKRDRSAGVFSRALDEDRVVKNRCGSRRVLTWLHNRELVLCRQVRRSEDAVLKQLIACDYQSEKLLEEYGYLLFRSGLLAEADKWWTKGCKLSIELEEYGKSELLSVYVQNMAVLHGRICEPPLPKTTDGLIDIKLVSSVCARSL